MFWLLFFVIAGCIFGLAWGLHKYFEWQELKKKQSMELLLGVPQKYGFDQRNVEDRVRWYDTQKDLFEDEYADENGIPDDKDVPGNWLSTLKPEKKDQLKVLLMQRAMGWVIVYRELEKDLKSNYPLYRKGIITPDYWFSIKDWEERLEKQFDSIKKEATAIEPKQEATTIFREAVMMVDKYGLDKWGVVPDPEDVDSPSDDNLAGGANAQLKGKGKGAGKGKGMGAGAGPMGAGPGAKGASKGMGGKPWGPPPGAPGGDIVRQYTDGQTYAIQQEENDVELQVYVPPTVKKSDIKVELKPSSVTVLLMGRKLFGYQMHPWATIAWEGSMWTLWKRGDYEPGDEVELSGLTMKKYNGGTAKVLKPDKDTAKDRVRVELVRPDKGRSLSIKAENLRNLNNTKRAAVIINIEKARKGSVWPMPPWSPN